MCDGGTAADETELARVERAQAERAQAGTARAEGRGWNGCVGGTR
jgi:hypothetical protein